MRTICRPIALVCILAAVGCPEPDGELLNDDTTFAEQITESALMDHLTNLEAIATANDGNRMFLSGGYLDSVDYIVEQLEDVGLEPIIEEFDIEAYTIDSASVSVNGEAPSDLEDIDFAVFELSGSGTVTATVTGVDLTVPPDGGANSTDSGCDSRDFDGFPVGDIALIQRGSCTFVQKVDNAVAAGASAVVVFNEGQQGRRDIVQGQLDGGIASIPVVGVGYGTGRSLSQAVDLQLTVQIDANVSVSTDRNILLDFPGGDAARTILVGAHLDGVEAGPGVNDNGSGSAFLLELALQMLAGGIEPTNRVQFAWWGAEEQGLIGSSRYFYSDNGDPNDAVLGTLDAYLNFDMLASGNGVRMVYDGDGSDFDDGVDSDGSALIEELFETYFADNDMATRPEALLIPSDSYWPALLGVPTGGLFSGAFQAKTNSEEGDFGGDEGTAHDPCYHQACDTVSNTNPVLYEELAQAGASVILDLAMREDAFPSGNTRRSVRDLPKPRGCHDHTAWDR
ncbi:MAG: Zn-dependent M28 family amino/carboxypeptidase [Myxococcota bacterium]